MGRSTTSCFKIISCGCINDSVERDETNVPSENKAPDKPRWSFQKNSPTRRVQSNTVVTETIPSSENKQIPEPITISSEPQTNINISEKTADNIWTEETPNLITKNATVSTTATKPASEEDDIICEPAHDKSEPSIIVIQAAVRRFLAERRLMKHKNVVKLQAAVRGHLVRNHAVGTLRCVQAIVKMQALVRARRQKGVQNAAVNSTPTHVSVEKLLSNRLARQLLESTPKTKQINIKCDPLKSDSAWNWLERWMSVSTPETLETNTPDHDQEKAVNNTENESKMVISSNNVVEAIVRLEEKDKLVNYEESSNVKTHEEEPIVEPVVIPVSETKPTPIPENLVLETEPKPIPEEQDPEVVLRADIGSSATKKATLVTDVEPGDYLATHGSRMVQNGGSECGTELSITSTVDSPDRTETENKKLKEGEVVNEAVGDMNMNNDSDNNNNIDIVMPEKQVDQKLDDSDIDPPESSHHVYESNEHESVVQLSVSGSPRSHITTLESQGTPSSQVSTTTKKTKSDRKASGQRQKSWSTSTKSSPVRSSVSSGLRSSLDQLPKDPKPMKRRNSSGSPKPDHSDHEPSVPSYMQPTESARAKAVSSPRSSPDVHDKESYMKKRHSLPAVNGRQGSPRVQRSMSQALQTTKGNSSQERKWQR